jgi:hypothetical protein
MRLRISRCLFLHALHTFVYRISFRDTVRTPRIELCLKLTAIRTHYPEHLGRLNVFLGHRFHIDNSILPFPTVINCLLQLLTDDV